jgi:hypothetical protein
VYRRNKSEVGGPGPLTARCPPAVHSSARRHTASGQIRLSILAFTLALTLAPLFATTGQAQQVGGDSFNSNPGTTGSGTIRQLPLVGGACPSPAPDPTWVLLYQRNGYCFYRAPASDTASQFNPNYGNNGTGPGQFQSYATPSYSRQRTPINSRPATPGRWQPTLDGGMVNMDNGIRLSHDGWQYFLHNGAFPPGTVDTRGTTPASRAAMTSTEKKKLTGYNAVARGMDQREIHLEPPQTKAGLKPYIVPSNAGKGGFPVPNRQVVCPGNTGCPPPPNDRK